MLTQPSKHAWLCRFGERLVQLRPGMSVLSAVQHAQQTYVSAAVLEPEEAADLFVEVNFMAEPIAMVRSEVRVEDEEGL